MADGTSELRPAPAAPPGSACDAGAGTLVLVTSSIFGIVR
jgi:hypothetical protein